MTEKLQRSVIEPKNSLLNASRSSNLPHVPGIRVGDYIFLSGMVPVDPQTGERLDDVLMFRVADLGVKELLLADDRGMFFTTPHFDGYPAVLMRIPDLAGLDRDELEDLVVEAWLTRAQKRVATAWLEEHAEK